MKNRLHIKRLHWCQVALVNEKTCNHLLCCVWVLIWTALMLVLLISACWQILNHMLCAFTVTLLHSWLHGGLWRPVKYCFSISEVFLDTFRELGLTCKMAFKWLCASLIYISYMYMYGSPVHFVALMSKLLRLLLFLNTILGVEASRMLLN